MNQKDMTYCHLASLTLCHCEERSDEAISINGGITKTS